MTTTGPLGKAKVIESTVSAPGTGSFTLGGAFGLGSVTFVAAVGSGNGGFYTAEDADGANWEEGFGIATSGANDTLTRAFVFSSSNGGAKVNFQTAPTVFMPSLGGGPGNSVLSGHMGSTRPTWMQAGGRWIDNTNDPTWTIKLYDGADDIAIADFNTTTNTITPYFGAAALAVISQAEAEAGTATTPRLFTAQRVAQAAAAASPAELTGTVKQYIGATAPTGWLLLNGDTIGSAASAATHAADGNEALFTLLWDSMADAQAPVSGGRGASAAADWAANKTITLPDARGRTIISTDTDSGGTTRTHGDTGGAETVTLTETDLPSHVHAAGTLATASDGAHTHTIDLDNRGSIADAAARHLNGGVDGTDATSSAGAHTHNITGSTGSIGSDGAHNNMPPWLALNYIVKT